MTLTEEQMIDFLFVSSLFGRVVANNSVAGATGGCQAEVGSAFSNGSCCSINLWWRTGSIWSRYGISD